MFTLDKPVASCTVQYMELSERMQRIQELANERSSILADLESVTNDLRSAVRFVVESGEASEVAVHNVTGLSRTTIRAWLGKT
jgi:hypothetical protein